MYSELSRTSKMEHFAEIVNNFYPQTKFAKSSILDLGLDSELSEKVCNCVNGKVKVDLTGKMVCVDGECK